MIGVRYTICHQAINRTDPQNSLSTTLDVPLQALVIINREPEYEISKIVDSKIDRRRAYKLLYNIIWLGYEDTDNDSKWLPATELKHAKELLNDFHLKYLSKPGPLQP